MLKTTHIFLFMLVTIFVASCAGYRVRDRGNPFEQEKVRVLAIPMFINKSIYPGVAPIFTREIARLMASYPGLKLRTTTGGDEDAVLLGIIESPQRYSQAYNTTATKFTAGALQTSIGNRAQYYLPTSSSYKISVRLVMIKNPGKLEKELLASSLGSKIKGQPGSKVVFQQSFSYEGNFNRASQDTITPDSGGITNYSKTRRFFIQTIESLAVSTAQNVEDLVINVF